jgi:hypothetical protein
MKVKTSTPSSQSQIKSTSGAKFSQETPEVPLQVSETLISQKSRVGDAVGLPVGDAVGLLVGDDVGERVFLDVLNSIVEFPSHGTLVKGDTTSTFAVTS